MAADVPNAGSVPLAGPLASTGAPVRESRLRSGDAPGPFAQPDLWTGTGPPAKGLQRQLGAGDIPGPLLPVLYSGVGVFRVYDMCGVTEATFREGADFSSVVYRYGYDTARRFHRGCSQSRFMAEAKSAWIDNERRYFRWRNQAERWVEDRRDEHDRARMDAERGSTVPQPNTPAYGSYDSVGRWFGGGPFGIVFATNDAPVDEVQVLVDSVAVRGGVLRGLVRNWSRHLWAYGVTVTAGDGEFRWPLSMQPGEVAPFEIAGWEGPEDAGLIQVRVDTDMSWHADPSRAWEVEPRFGRTEVVVSDLTRRPLSGSVRDRYAHVAADIAADSISLGSVPLDARLEAPTSHPSLRGFYENVAIGDLRGYGAIFDADGRVVDVVPVPAVVWTEWDETRSEFTDYGEVSSLPYPPELQPYAPRDPNYVYLLFDIHPVHDGLAIDGHSIGEPGEGYRTDVLFDDEYETIGGRRFPLYGVMHGEFIVWVGAAHPARAVS